MSFGLSDDAIAKINSVFSRHTAVTKVILFGSRAKGNYKEGSDIDLALFGKHMDHHTLNQIAQELDDLMLPYKIDTVVYDDLTSPELKEHINSVGKNFYLE